MNLRHLYSSFLKDTRKKSWEKLTISVNDHGGFEAFGIFYSCLKFILLFWMLLWQANDVFIICFNGNQEKHSTLSLMERNTEVLDPQPPVASVARRKLFITCFLFVWVNCRNILRWLF